MSVKSLFMENSLATFENETYFNIDGTSRTITPPSNFKNFGVESDEKSNRIYFEVPRFVGDNIDLSKLNIRVNYQNAKGEKDQYIVNDVVVDGDVVHFSWLLSRKATMYNGSVSFIVCAIKTDSNGTITNEWNTSLCTGTVLAGLEVENPEITEDVTDLVNQLVDLLNNSISEIETTKTETIKNIKVVEEEVITNIENTPNTLYANAIKGKASGEVIRVDDVSPITHNVDVDVNGKNLFDIDKALNECFVKNEDGTYTFTRTTDNRFSNEVDLFISANTTITISGVNILEEGYKSLCMQFRFTDNTTDFVALSFEKNVHVCTFEKNIHQIRLYMLASAEVGNYKTLNGIQIEKGDTATEYEPYIDPTTVTLSVGEDETNVTTYTPDENGKVTFTSITPTMTLFTDTENVNIECEYNKDTNKVINEILERIVALESEV